MKIDTNRIPPEGLTLEEDVSPVALDLETDIVRFPTPIKIKADVYRITNAVTVLLSLKTSMYTNCSRCLNALEINFEKKSDLNYPINKQEPIIDLGPQIREELILDYPIKPLCNPNCKGLCYKCGRNLNEGDCSCVNLGGK